MSYQRFSTCFSVDLNFTICTNICICFSIVHRGVEGAEQGVEKFTARIGSRSSSSRARKETHRARDQKDGQRRQQTSRYYQQISLIAHMLD